MRAVVAVHGIGCGGAESRKGFSAELESAVKTRLPEGGRLIWREAVWEGVNDRLCTGIKEAVSPMVFTLFINSRNRWVRIASRAACAAGLGRLAVSALENTLDAGLDLPLYMIERRGSRIRAIVRSEVEANPGCVLVAHSLGSVICYDLLRKNPGLPVGAFVSFGSPLGLIKKLQFGENVFKPAKLAIDWTNFYIRKDPACLGKGLAEELFPGVRNEAACYTGHTRHAHTAYWHNDDIARHIADLVRDNAVSGEK